MSRPAGGKDSKLFYSLWAQSQKTSSTIINRSWTSSSLPSLIFYPSLMQLSCLSSVLEVRTMAQRCDRTGVLTGIVADTPYLQGRAFVFASQFITALPESAGADFLSQALSAIAHEETSIPVKLSAIRGIVK